MDSNLAISCQFLGFIRVGIKHKFPNYSSTKSTRCCIFFSTGTITALPTGRPFRFYRHSIANYIHLGRLNKLEGKGLTQSEKIVEKIVDYFES